MFGMKSRGQSGPERDLGFGSVLASESGARLLNQDKSFNTQRVGLGPLASLHLYDALLTISWPRFLALVAIAYLVSNVAFAFAYMALGPEALTGALHRGLRKHRARFGRRETARYCATPSPRSGWGQRCRSESPAGCLRQTASRTRRSIWAAPKARWNPSRAPTACLREWRLEAR